MAKKKMTTIICGKFTTVLNDERFYKLVELIYEKGVLIERKEIGKTFRGNHFPRHKIKDGGHYEIHRVPFVDNKRKALTHRPLKPIKKPD